MPMTMPELERALRTLRLSGMTATLEARALQVAHQEMDVRTLCDRWHERHRAAAPRSGEEGDRL